MNKKPKISVIMPVYNTKEEWLKQAIESILNQTYSDFEFLIINDGSTNNARDVILSYKDPRIKYIEQENMGFVASLNKGLDIATGEYIAKMDSDDISLADRLQKQVQYLDTHPNIGLVGGGYKAFDKADFSVIHPAKVSLLDMLKCCCTTIFMLRKSIIEQHNIRFRKEYIHAEDYDFYARFLRVSDIANIEEILYFYRWHGQNASITQAKSQYENSEKTRQNILDLLAGDNEEYRKKILELIFPPPKTKQSFLENIFSVKNSRNKKHKVITILGLKIKLKRKTKNNT